MCRVLFAALLAVLVASAASAAIVVPGAEGWDGPFAPTGASYVVDLSKAATGQWDGTPEVPGNGVYDPEKWAVVFKYESVNVPAGCTVTFKNHPSRAPVVWLVSGDVTIAGKVVLDGADSVTTGEYAEPGPGGFRGGAGILTGLGGSAGFGPGGGNVYYPAGWSEGRSSGSYSTGGEYYVTTPVVVTYGGALIQPLIGGSGGTSYQQGTYSGGGGGGALLIAAAGIVTVSGTVSASGGNAHGGGSGGAVRIVAETLTGAGAIMAKSKGNGGLGRIRFEANARPFAGSVTPAATFSTTPITTAQIWPPESFPSLKVLSLGGQQVPYDPTAGVVLGSTDVAFGTAGNQRVVVEASNVPLDWVVRARAASRGANAVFVDLTRTGGDESSSTWEGDVNLPQGITAIQVRAAKP